MLQFGHQAIAEQGGVGFGVGSRVLVLSLGGGHQGLLRQKRRRGIGISAPQPGGGGVELQPRVDDFLLERRIVQLEHHRVWLDLGPWPQQDASDAAIGRGGNPRRVDGNEGAGASDLAHQFAALDRVEPQRRAIHGGRGRRHAQHGDTAGNHEHRDNGRHPQALQAATTTIGGTEGNVRHAGQVYKERASLDIDDSPVNSTIWRQATVRMWDDASHPRRRSLVPKRGQRSTADDSPCRYQRSQRARREQHAGG